MRRRGIFITSLPSQTETLEEFVVYECLYDNPTSKIWVRPKEKFLEEVEINDKHTPRFIFIGE